MAVHLIYKSLPTVALRGMVVFPGMRLHFEVGRDKSIQAIQAAVREGQRVFLVTQRSVAVEDPDRDDLFEMGVIASVKQLVQSPDNKKGSRRLHPRKRHTLPAVGAITIMPSTCPLSVNA